MTERSRQATRARARAAEDDDPDAGEELSRPQAPKSSKMVSARVTPGNTVILGETDEDGNAREVAYRGGQSVSVSEDDIKARPWAFEATGERRRSGQTTRLQRRVKELEDEVERLREQDKDAKKNARRDEAGHAAAVESVLARGDNYAGRNEPQIGSVPPDVVDTFESNRDRAALREAGRLSLDDEAGMHGIGREQASGPVTGAGSIAGAQVSNPSTVDPTKGESQRPGSSEASSGDK